MSKIMHISFLFFVILAVICSLISVQLDRCFVRSRRLNQPTAPTTQQLPPEA